MLISRRGVLGSAGAIGAATGLGLGTPSPAEARDRRVRVIRQRTDQGRVIVVMPHPRPKRRPPLVVFHHGAGKNAEQTFRNRHQGRLIRDLAAAGACVAVSDFGGNLWGNAENQRHISRLIRRMQRRFALKGPVVLMGSSMGAAAVLAWTAAHPERVHSVVALKPVVDLADAKRQRLGLAHAYKPGYSDRRFGAEHNPMVQAGMTSPARGRGRSFDGIPMLLVTGADDSVAPTRLARRFVARVRRGSNTSVRVREIKGAKHGDKVIARVATEEVIDFLRGAR